MKDIVVDFFDSKGIGHPKLISNLHYFTIKVRANMDTGHPCKTYVSISQGLNQLQIFDLPIHHTHRCVVEIGSPRVPKTDIDCGSKVLYKP